MTAVELCIVVGGIVYLMFLSTSKVGRIAILATFVYDNSTQPLIDGVYIRHVCTISVYDKCVRYLSILPHVNGVKSEYYTHMCSYIYRTRNIDPFTCDTLQTE